MWRRSLQLGFIFLFSFAMVWSADVDQNRQMENALAKYDAGQNLTQAEKQLIDDELTLRQNQLSNNNRVLAIAESNRDNSGSRSVTSLGFEDDSDVGAWGVHGGTSGYTTVGWEAFSGVGGTGALVFGDGGYGFYIKRAVTGGAGLAYSFSVDVKTTGWVDAYELSVTVEGLSTVEPTVVISNATAADFVTYTLSGTADAGTEGYILFSGSNGFVANTVTIDNFVFDNSAAAVTNLVEGFENGFPPTGWVTINADGDSYYFNETFQYIDASTGSYGAQAKGCQDDWMITPKLSPTTGDVTLTYWEGLESSSYPYTYDLLVSTTDSDTASFTVLGSYDGNTTGWMQRTVDLTAYADQDIFVAWHVKSMTSTGWDFGFDDVVGPEMWVSTGVPGVASNPFPADGATDVELDAYLAWSVGMWATGSDLSFGTDNPPTNIENGTDQLATLAYDPASLSYGTTYYWSVTPYNSYGDATSATVWSFTTVADPTLFPPFSEAMEAIPPVNWSKYYGYIAADSTDIASSTSGFILDDYLNDTGNSGSARVNIYGTSRNHWLVSPDIDLGDGSTAYELVFDLGQTAYSGTGVEVMGDDDRFILLMSDDNQWGEANIVQEWNSTSAVIANAGEVVKVDLSAYTGVVKFAFYAESTVSNTDYNVYVDNFGVQEPPVVPVVALNPLDYNFGGMAVGNTASTDITVTNNGGADLVIASVTVAAPYSASYAGTIAVGASDVITVSYAPTDAGAFAETLTLDITGDYDGDAAVTLAGTAYPADFALEGFENGFPPFGWTIIDVDGGSAFNPDLSYIDPHSGDVGAEAMGCADDYLITPSLSIPAGYAEFSFWHGQESTTRENSFEVMVSVTGTEVADFVQVADFPMINPPTSYAWSMESIDLSAYAGQDIFVAIHVYYSESSYYGFGFDDFVMPPLTPSTNTLFFSEYMEGSGDYKAFEIYNGTGVAVDMADYIVLGNYNGNPWSDTLRFEAGTMLASDDVYVIAHADIDPMVAEQADSLVQNPYAGGTSYMTVFNGDDVRALVSVAGGDTTVLDYIGLYDLIDPGSGWAVAGVDNATKDHTITRKPSVETGNTDWLASAGTTTEDSEWIVYEQNYWYGFGYHNEDYPLPGDVCNLALDYGSVNDLAVTGAIESYGSAWYSFENDGSFDNVIVSLCDSEFDTKIEVWAGCDSATYIAYNDDACGTRSQVEFEDLAAGTYWVKVYGWSSSSGNYTLNVTGTNGMPDFEVTSMNYTGQDTLDVVVTNIGETDSPGYFGTDYHGLYINGDYLGYVVEPNLALMAGESFTYTLVGINYDFLGAGVHEVVFEADTDDDVEEFDETNNADTLMIDILVPPATPRHLMAVASAEQVNLTWDPAPEESYELPTPLSGVYDRKTKYSNEDAVVLQKWADISAQNAGLRETGDDCTDPYIVTALPFDDTSSTAGFANSFTYGNGNDVVYRVTVAEDGYLYGNTCGGTTGDTKMQIFAADCATELDYNDDACGLRSEVMTPVTAGDYMVVVDGYSSGDVDYILNISFSTELDAPDMTVSDMWMEEDVVYAEISNIGTLDITSSSVSCRWYVDGEYIGYQYPDALPVGSSDTLAISGFSYANLGPGDFQVMMVADYWDSIDEQNEANNEDSLTVTISEPTYIPTFNVYRDAALIASAVEPIDFAFHGGYMDWGLVPGDYCYTVTQIMPDLSESGTSNESCASITPNPPVGLSLMVNPDASASLNWMAPMPAGEMGYDDGSAESWMWVGGPSSTDHMMALRFNAPVGEFNISNIAVFGLGDEPSMFENLYIVGGDGAGMPDFSNVLFTAPAVNMNGTWDTGAEWTIVPAGVPSTNSEFFVIAQWPEGSEIGPFVGTDDDVLSDRSFWSNDAGASWNGWSGMFMMHAFVEVGGTVVAVGPTDPVIRNISSVDVPALVNTTVEAPEFGLIPNDRSFLGTFKVHRGTEAGVYDSVLVADLNGTMFMDAPELGETEYFYAVSANYDEGDSPFSNEVSFVPEALAWIDLDIDMESMFVDLDYGDVYGSASFDLMSIGLDTLDYTIEYHAPMGRVDSRSIEGSSMFSPDMPPMPGTTVDLAVYLQNTSGDSEWLDSASVTWPAGITVNSSSDFVVVDNDAHYLSTNNAIGDGATVEWFNHDGGYGNIYGNETAMSIMNVTVDAAFTGDIYFDYFILGDIWGADPHEVSGSFVFMFPAFLVDIEPDENLLPGDSTDAILLNVDVVEYQPGFYPGFISIYSNAVNAPEEIMFPFNVKLAPPMGSLAGNVSSSFDGAAIEGAFVVALDTMMWEEYYTETMADGSYFLDLPVGNYEVGIGHHDYFPVDANVDIAMDVTTTLDAVLDANVMAPVDLAADEDGGVYLTWDMPMMEFPIFYHDGEPTNGFYQNFGSAYGTVFDLSMFGDASIEYLDFVHYGWGLGGLFDYNVHIIDWTDFSTIDVITGLTTEFDVALAPMVEFGIDLGGLDGFTQVGLFIEPLSGTADDAYPDLSTDASAPAMPGTSFIIDLAAIDASGDLSVNNPTMGDFMLNLWIIAEDGAPLVAAPILGDDNSSRDGDPIDPDSKGSISGWTDLGIPMEDQGLRSEFANFNIYSNVDGAGWNMIGMSDSLGYFDDSVLPGQNIDYTVSAVYDIAESATSDTVSIYYVSTDDVGLPTTYALEQNYPNPFNPVTFIRYQLPEATDVKIVVYNVLGQKVATLVDQNMNAGYHSISWSGLNHSGSPVSSGVYLYRIEADNFSDVKKLMFLK